VINAFTSTVKKAYKIFRREVCGVPSASKAQNFAEQTTAIDSYLDSDNTQDGALSDCMKKICKALDLPVQKSNVVVSDDERNANILHMLSTSPLSEDFIHSQEGAMYVLQQNLCTLKGNQVFADEELRQQLDVIFSSMKDTQECSFGRVPGGCEVIERGWVGELRKYEDFSTQIQKAFDAFSLRIKDTDSRTKLQNAMQQCQHRKHLRQTTFFGTYRSLPNIGVNANK